MDLRNRNRNAGNCGDVADDSVNVNVQCGVVEAVVGLGEIPNAWDALKFQLNVPIGHRRRVGRVT